VGFASLHYLLLFSHKMRAEECRTNRSFCHPGQAQREPGPMRRKQVERFR